MSESIDTVDVAVIGAGPAGLMAAVQAARQGLSLKLFEKSRPGGQALAANFIENFPGILEGLRGPDLMQRFLKQADAHGICITREAVTKIHSTDGRFTVETDRGRCDARSAIIASGLIPRTLNIPGEKELLGRRIFSYADPSTIDHAGKDVMVIGSGDAAFDQALNFARRAARVAIAMKGPAPKCNRRLLQMVGESNIEVLPQHIAAAVSEGEDRVEITFADGKCMKFDLIITCIGKEKNFDFIDPDLLDRDIHGIFFVGDCCRGRDRHIAIACGDGIAAAMRAAEFLK